MLPFSLQLINGVVIFVTTQLQANGNNSRPVSQSENPDKFAISDHGFMFVNVCKHICAICGKNFNSEWLPYVLPIQLWVSRRPYLSPCENLTATLMSLATAVRYSYSFELNKLCDVWGIQVAGTATYPVKCQLCRGEPARHLLLVGH